MIRLPIASSDTQGPSCRFDRLQGQQENLVVARNHRRFPDTQLHGSTRIESTRRHSDRACRNGHAKPARPKAEAIQRFRPYSNITPKRAMQYLVSILSVIHATAVVAEVTQYLEFRTAFSISYAIRRASIKLPTPLGSWRGILDSLKPGGLFIGPCGISPTLSFFMACLKSSASLSGLRLLENVQLSFAPSAVTTSFIRILAQ